MNYKLIYLASRNPSVPIEQWPRTWRSHAVFASQFPVIGASILSLYYCNRVVGPASQPPGVSDKHDGVAIVSSATVDALSAEFPADVRARIDQDELRVFATLTPNFSFHAKEVLVHGGAPSQSAVVRFLVRKQGTTREAFASHLGGAYAEIARRAAETSGTVKRYVHNELTRDPPPGYPFDAITETWFANVEDAVRSFTDETFATLIQDHASFCDIDRSVTMLTDVIHRWPRS